MEKQRTAYRQIRSIFEIASTPKTNFGSITLNKFNICIHWLESVWKHNAQHIAELGQYLRLHKFQILVSIWNSINPKY